MFSSKKKKMSLLMDKICAKITRNIFYQEKKNEFTQG